MKKYVMYHIIILLFVLYCAPLISMDSQDQKKLPFPKVLTFGQYDNFDYLLSGNGNSIKRIINEDPITNINSITTIENTLKAGLESNNYKSLHGIYDENLLQFVRCIAYRQEDCKQWRIDIEWKNFDKAEEILTRNPYIANYLFINPHYGGFDGSWTTPLHYILDKAQSDTDFRDNHSLRVLKTLLEAGADANAIGIDKNGNTPLHKASLVKHIELLWKFGARTEIKNKDGQTPLMKFYLRKLDNLMDFLIGSGADLNAQDIYGNTILHWAAKEANHNTCRTFLKCGASFMIANKEGKTVGCYAQDIPKLRKKIEPYMQQSLWQALSCHNFKWAKRCMTMYPWINLIVKDKSIIDWIDEAQRPKAAEFFHKILIEIASYD